eukprot:gene13172-21401_t
MSRDALTTYAPHAAPPRMRAQTRTALSRRHGAGRVSGGGRRAGGRHRAAYARAYANAARPPLPPTLTDRGVRPPADPGGRAE